MDENADLSILVGLMEQADQGQNGDFLSAPSAAGSNTSCLSTGNSTFYSTVENLSVSSTSQAQQPINRLKGYAFHNLLSYTSQQKKMGTLQLVSRPWQHISHTSPAWCRVRTVHLGTYDRLVTAQDYTPHTFYYVHSFAPEFNVPPPHDVDGVNQYLNDAATHQSVAKVLKQMVDVKMLIVSGQIPPLIGYWLFNTIDTNKYLNLKILSIVIYPMESLAFWFALLEAIKKNPNFIRRIKLRCHFGHHENPFTFDDDRSNTLQQLQQLFDTVLDCGAEIDELGLGIYGMRSADLIIEKLNNAALKGILHFEMPEDHDDTAPTLLAQVVNSLQPQTLHKITWQLGWESDTVMDTYSVQGLLPSLNSAAVSEVRSLDVTGVFDILNNRLTRYDPYYDNCTKVLKLLKEILAKMPKLTKLVLQPGNRIPPSFRFDMASFGFVIDFLAERALKDTDGMLVNLKDVLEMAGAGETSTFESDVAVMLKQMFPEDAFELKTRFRWLPGMGEFKLELFHCNRPWRRLELNVEWHRHLAPAPAPLVHQPE